MAIFVYNTKDYQGEYHKGEVEAADESQASIILRRKKLIVISLKKRNENEQHFWDKYLNRVAFADVVIVTRQLSTMVSAGLVLSEALDILSEQQTSKQFKHILETISSDIKGGLDFASALDKHPEVFPSIYSKLVRAGQASGKLDNILSELANNLEKERAFRSRIKGAMIYPIVVITMMVGVMLVMVFFVMPKLTSLYTDSGIELPLPTQILMAITSTMVSYWWAVITVLIIGISSIKRYISTPQGHVRYDAFLLKVPIVGKIISLVILTNFTRTFALLVSSGISILEAINIVTNVAGNLTYRNALETAYQGVERGLTFSSQLLAQPIFPKIVGQMIKTGEETGKLDEIMFKIADYFEAETDNALKNVTTLIEPIILVLMGIGVAFLVISIILPIYQLTTSIK